MADSNNASSTADYSTAINNAQNNLAYDASDASDIYTGAAKFAGLDDNTINNNLTNISQLTDNSSKYNDLSQNNYNDDQRFDWSQKEYDPQYSGSVGYSQIQNSQVADAALYHAYVSQLSDKNSFKYNQTQNGSTTAQVDSNLAAQNQLNGYNTSPTVSLSPSLVASYQSLFASVEAHPLSFANNSAYAFDQNSIASVSNGANPYTDPSYINSLMHVSLASSAVSGVSDVSNSFTSPTQSVAPSSNIRVAPSSAPSSSSKLIASGSPSMTSSMQSMVNSLLTVSAGSMNLPTSISMAPSQVAQSAANAISQSALSFAPSSTKNVASASAPSLNSNVQSLANSSFTGNAGALSLSSSSATPSLASGLPSPIYSQAISAYTAQTSVSGMTSSQTASLISSAVTSLADSANGMPQSSSSYANSSQASSASAQSSVANSLIAGFSSLSPSALSSLTGGKFDGNDIQTEAQQVASANAASTDPGFTSYVNPDGSLINPDGSGPLSNAHKQPQTAAPKLKPFKVKSKHKEKGLNEKKFHGHKSKHGSSNKSTTEAIDEFNQTQYLGVPDLRTGGTTKSSNHHATTTHKSKHSSKSYGNGQYQGNSLIPENLANQVNNANATSNIRRQGTKSHGKSKFTDQQLDTLPTLITNLSNKTKSNTHHATKDGVNKSLYAKRITAHKTKGVNGKSKYTFDLNAKSRADVDKSQYGGRYLNNSGTHLSHAQPISHKEFNQLLSVNGLPSLSNQQINSAIAKKQPIATGSDNLAFNATVVKSKKPGYNNIDFKTVKAPSKPFDYKREHQIETEKVAAAQTKKSKAPKSVKASKAKSAGHGMAQPMQVNATLSPIPGLPSASTQPLSAHVNPQSAGLKRAAKAASQAKAKITEPSALKTNHVKSAAKASRPASAKSTSHKAAATTPKAAPKQKIKHHGGHGAELSI